MSNSRGTDYTLLFRERSNLENDPLPRGYQRELALSLRGEIRLPVHLLGPEDNPKTSLHVYPLKHLVELGPPSPPPPGIVPRFKIHGHTVHFQHELREQGRSNRGKGLE